MRLIILLINLFIFAYFFSQAQKNRAIISEIANFRSTPLIENNNIIDTLKKGDRLTFFMMYGDWSLVSFNSDTGYISSKLISKPDSPYGENQFYDFAIIDSSGVKSYQNAILHQTGKYFVFKFEKNRRWVFKQDTLKDNAQVSKGRYSYSQLKCKDNLGQSCLFSLKMKEKGRSTIEIIYPNNQITFNGYFLKNRTNYPKKRKF